MSPNDRTSRRARTRLVAGQFARFLVVGALSFSVDFGLFLLLHNVFGVQYLVASTTSFALSLVLNYFLTLRFVFRARPGRSIVKEFSLYLGLNIIALGLNQLILFVSVDVFGLDPIVGKLIATAVVLVFNFISRKILIERGTREPPTPTATASPRTEPRRPVENA